MDNLSTSNKYIGTNLGVEYYTVWFSLFPINFTSVRPSSNSRKTLLHRIQEKIVFVVKG